MFLGDVNDVRAGRWIADLRLRKGLLRPLGGKGARTNMGH